MRLCEAEAPYAFINQFTIQKVGKLGPVVMHDTREEKDQDKDSFTVMLYDHNINVDLIPFTHDTEEHDWRQGKEVTVAVMEE